MCTDVLSLYMYTFNSIISSLQNYTVLGIYINTLNIGYDFRCWMMRSLIDCQIAPFKLPTS